MRIQYTGENKDEIAETFGLTVRETTDLDGLKLLACYPLISPNLIARPGDYFVSDPDGGAHVEKVNMPMRMRRRD